MCSCLHTLTPCARFPCWLLLFGDRVLLCSAGCGGTRFVIPISHLSFLSVGITGVYCHTLPEHSYA